MEYKTCKTCEASKPITEFYKYYGYIHGTCKECRKKYQQKYRRTTTETKECRRLRYIKESLKSGMIYRVGLKYVLDSPTNNTKKCTKCKQYKPQENFGADKRARDGRRTICKTCTSKKRRENYTPRIRKHRTKDEEQKHNRDYMRTYTYLTGDGCCLYCGETDFWKLNNHHPWKKMDPNFTITLCENHHAPFSRGMPLVLKEWCAPTTDKK